MARSIRHAALLVFLLACACSKCPDPEDSRTVMMAVQDETAQQALTASVNVASFALKSAGEDYVSLRWSPATLKNYAQGSEVCTYKLVFDYLGTASAGALAVYATVLPLVASTQQLLPQRGPLTMQTVQYTNVTQATHHGLPPSTPVRIALHVCLFVNASTMVCVHVADANATTNPFTGSLPSAPTTAAHSSYSISQPEPTVPDTSKQEVSVSDVPFQVGLPSGIGGVAIVAATVVVLTLISLGGVACFVYRRCRSRWDHLPSHFWTIELQNEYDAVSFSDAPLPANDNVGTTFAGSRNSGSARTDDHRRRLLDAQDNPYRLLTA